METKMKYTWSYSRPSSTEKESIQDDIIYVFYSSGTHPNTFAQYKENGGAWELKDIVRNFGSYYNALANCGIHESFDENELFNDLEMKFQDIRGMGRQIQMKDISEMSVVSIMEKYGTWQNCLNAFYAWRTSVEHWEMTTKKNFVEENNKRVHARNPGNEYFTELQIFDCILAKWKMIISAGGEQPSLADFVPSMQKSIIQRFKSFNVCMEKFCNYQNSLNVEA